MQPQFTAHDPPSTLLAGLVSTQAAAHAIRLARSALRQTDWIARYGGEEFVIVLPETHLEGAFAVAERMRRLCAETSIELPDAQLVVTASFGVDSIDGVAAGKDDGEAILKQADEALYQSKRTGRNRVTCGPKAPVPDPVTV